jgi:hypothetical protein
MCGVVRNLEKDFLLSRVSQYCAHRRKRKREDDADFNGRNKVDGL